MSRWSKIKKGLSHPKTRDTGLVAAPGLALAASIYGAGRSARKDIIFKQAIDRKKRDGERKQLQQTKGINQKVKRKKKNRLHEDHYYNLQPGSIKRGLAISAPPVAASIGYYLKAYRDRDKAFGINNRPKHKKRIVKRKK